MTPTHRRVAVTRNGAWRVFGRRPTGGGGPLLSEQTVRANGPSKGLGSVCRSKAGPPQTPVDPSMEFHGGDVEGVVWMLEREVPGGPWRHLFHRRQARWDSPWSPLTQKTGPLHFDPTLRTADQFAAPTQNSGEADRVGEY